MKYVTLALFVCVAATASVNTAHAQSSYSRFVRVGYSGGRTFAQRINFRMLNLAEARAQAKIESPRTANAESKIFDTRSGGASSVGKFGF